jgi:hypothetical protein
MNCETRETKPEPLQIISEAIACAISEALGDLIKAYQEDGERLEAISCKITGDRSVIYEFMADLSSKTKDV